ncbi:MAG: hypothetical protein E7331_01210 [Clostridiales bacterium]|nr:hypothetical protein [Clostridiales bacterium]
MFDNIGSKVKTQATFLCWCGIILSGIVGIILWTTELGFIWGLLVIVFGSLLSWLNAQFYYAIGEAADQATKAVRKLESIAKSLPKDTADKHPEEANAQPTIAPTRNTMTHSWACPDCGNQISENPCPHCKKTADPAVVIMVADASGGSHIVCPKCQTKNIAGRRICWNCGTRFEVLGTETAENS